jgi:hypothetical protein
MKKNKAYELVGEEWQPFAKNVDELIDVIKDEIDDWNYQCGPINIGGRWVFELEERYGGCEGGGDTHFVVFSLSQGGKKRFWQIDGFYQSNYGAELDGAPFEVIPVEKTIQVWNKK